MAIYHCSVKVISRKNGRSAVGCSAYRSGEKLHNERDGITHDYTKKGGVVYSEIMLPENAPTEYAKRERLWNEVEKIEKSNDNRVAREIEVALPIELNRKEQIQMVQEYVRENFVNKGMCADFSIHAGHSHRADKGFNSDGNITKENPHVHIMLTVRPIDQDGKWESKSEKIYLCKNTQGDEQGFTPTELKNVSDEWEKQYKYKSPKGKVVYLTASEAQNNQKYKDYERVSKDPKSLKGGRENTKLAEWNSQNALESWRENWANTVNRELEKKNLPQRVDHRSYEAQGIEKQPQIHLGVQSSQMENKGIQTDRGDINREIKQNNKKIEEINTEQRWLQQEMNLIRQDNYFIRLHEINDHIKSRLEDGKRLTENELNAYKKAISKLDGAVENMKIINADESRLYAVKEKDGQRDIPYMQYHIQKYEHDKEYLLKTMEKKLEEIKKSEQFDISEQMKTLTTQPNDLKGMAQGFEAQRKEYISIIQQINERSKYGNRPIENPIYERQANQIKEYVAEIQKQQSIVDRAEQEKSKLGMFKGKEKQEKQATIDRGNEQIESMKSKLKALGVSELSQADQVIAEKQAKADSEKEKIGEFDKQTKQLQERKAELQNSYLQRKGDLPADQKAEVEKWQAESRASQEADLSKLELQRAINQANRELEPKEVNEREREKNKEFDRSR